MKLAIIGISGLVGSTILKVLDEFDFELDELIPVASAKSVGKSIVFRNKTLKIISINDALLSKPDIAIFSAGKSVSLEYAPKFAEIGTYVIDNSSAWRMNKDIKLIVPEVNISLLEKSDKIIANPNCSTIQLVVVLWPLHKKYKLKRVVVSTYQSVTGSGIKGIEQLNSEKNNESPKNPAYPHTINENCLPHAGDFTDNGYTEEELKLIYETRKILGLENLKITSTVVRVPVLGGHSESVNIEFVNTPNTAEVTSCLGNSMGIIVEDNPSKNEYPMPINTQGLNETFVGRIREDFSNEKAINLWIVADNLRKGAATNTVQIAEYISDNFIND